MTSVTRLGIEDWSKAALQVIASEGVEQVTVEGLGRRLGVTKGSFYWHFANREALVTAALDLWEQRATMDVIEEVGAIVDPVARLRALFTASVGDVVDGPLDAALVATFDDGIVGTVVRRVTGRRLQFLERVFADLDFTPPEARTRARVAYSTYVGHFHVTRMLEGGERDGSLDVYISNLVDVLTNGRSESARAGAS
ncbi:MAG TPA: TetR/AcrR family transcriptional regulator [Ornithinimicrobium sp.]|uniref:TetR/AcrR family transcriptional regulator n=1 Tax=Ornithinimicrobium sp. TaxID=1977084 RepID=UPI002B464783|nr:TetR/AcrR family transcriptional regulator [Ornithinimicrobium sp.]HKJ10750.1 TetR/AcrR family transcriptional regulator [Ornithinimicrobium sp.]